MRGQHIAVFAGISAATVLGGYAILDHIGVPILDQADADAVAQIVAQAPTEAPDACIFPVQAGQQTINGELWHTSGNFEFDAPFLAKANPWYRLSKLVHVKGGCDVDGPIGHQKMRIILTNKTLDMISHEREMWDDAPVASAALSPRTVKTAPPTQYAFGNY